MYNGKAVLKDQKVVIVGDLLEWAKSFEGSDRIVKQDKIGDIKISTVFLGVDHGWEPGPHLWFETMIFGGEHDQYQERYETWDQAEKGHTMAVGIAFTAL